MMKTLSNNSKVAIAASLMAVLFAAGCERRTPTEETSGATSTPTAPSEAPAAAGVTPPTPVPESTAPAAPVLPADAGAKSAGQIVDDTVVTTKVKSALLADSDVKGLDVVVETSKGIVSLSGAVNNQAQIDRAAKIAGSVEGVNSVLNNLTIKKQ
ncbi:Osmotically-inducible protein Y precursor [compost metagenome]